MFDFTEEELTWEIVGKWTAKDTDLDYSIIVKYQPMITVDGYLGYPSGKPYKLMLMYFLKGSHLFIATLPTYRNEKDVKDFESKSLIDLRECSLMTKAFIDRKSVGIFFTKEKAFYIGEKFFFASNSEHGFYADMLPYRHAFTLRFPEKNCHSDWQDAMKFSDAIKKQIFLSQLKSNE
jgi:hypothetical protein